jgi:hypothetical protein
MQKRANLAFAVVLIVLGVWFLAVQMIPSLRDFVYAGETWPFIVIGVGLLLGLIGLVTGVPGLLIPACIVSGIGALLYWQNSTGNWESWAYAWTLIPGFAGVGVVLTGLLNRDRRAIIGGGWTIFNSLVLLAIFGSFLGGGNMVRYWPVLLILLGVMLLGQSLFRRR